MRLRERLQDGRRQSQGFVDLHIHAPLNQSSHPPRRPREVQRQYTAPFARASREDDYRVAWAFFADA